jgi:acetyl-CoA carboxylase biotin carboxyl carrier protein
MMEKKPKPLRSRVAQYIKGETTPGIDPDFVRELAALLEANNLTEIEVERGGVRVRVARGAPPAPQAAAPAPPSISGSGTPFPKEVATNPAPVRGTTITSPMVGTVYLSPQPGAPPFVKIGDMVKEGDTLCIIEAMKTMNPVPASNAGRIVDIQVHDAQPVEFGQPLIRID